ncbi:MAG: YqaE/Pmp3 family membrane protein [Verrucomicrobiales bacterium]|nr:YqaE/Pmp3 family membrane protein [Verrucomicrobiales bacterium]
MRYLIALLLPPLAVLLCGKPFQAVLNFFICVLFLWIPGIIHALLVVASTKSQENSDKIVQSNQKMIDLMVDIEKHREANEAMRQELLSQQVRQLPPPVPKDTNTIDAEIVMLPPPLPIKDTSESV